MGQNVLNFVKKGCFRFTVLRIYTEGYSGRSARSGQSASPKVSHKRVFTMICWLSRDSNPGFCSILAVSGCVFFSRNSANTRSVRCVGALPDRSDFILVGASALWSWKKPQSSVLRTEAKTTKWQSQKQCLGKGMPSQKKVMYFVLVVLTCFHASFFPFCPVCWPPLFLPFSRHLSTLFSPSKSALFCRAKGTAPGLESGSLRMDLSKDFGKEIPSRNLRKKRSVFVHCILAATLGGIWNG